MMKELAATLAEKPITLKFSEKALEYIANKAFSKKYGARNLRRFIQTNIEDKIAEEIISHYDNKLAAISIDVGEDNLTFNFI